MSTHIGDAWLIPTNRLPALVAIAQKATEIHRATIVSGRMQALQEKGIGRGKQPRSGGVSDFRPCGLPHRRNERGRSGLLGPAADPGSTCIFGSHD